MWWGSFFAVGGFSQYYAYTEYEKVIGWAFLNKFADGPPKKDGPDHSCCPSWDPKCRC